MDEPILTIDESELITREFDQTLLKDFILNEYRILNYLVFIVTELLAQTRFKSVKWNDTCFDRHSN
jgi:hypothetical protein